MTVNFYFEKPATLKERNRLKTFIASIFKKEKKDANTISYIFCSDVYLLNINRQFLKHDYYTDIITFNLTNSSADPTIAEIYISIDRVKDNARIQGVHIRQELHRVIIHGVLHLCGFKDKSALQKKIMRSQEDNYLRSYGLLA
ncbi:MAG: rRNA maturation RNase YbeY [Ferruginibacter sp.]